MPHNSTLVYTSISLRCMVQANTSIGPSGENHVVLTMGVKAPCIPQELWGQTPRSV
jgi:hypothetical protein